MLGAATRLSACLDPALVAIRSATEGMPDHEMTWHPQGKWSTAEILEHLTLAYSRTAERMRPLLERELPIFPSRTLIQWVGGIFTLRLGVIPVARKAPEALHPVGMTAAEVRTRIEESLSQMDQVIDRCEQRFGCNKRVMAHPFLGALSTSEWRKFHRVHTLHHMKQVQMLRQKMKEVHREAGTA